MSNSYTANECDVTMALIQMQQSLARRSMSKPMENWWEPYLQKSASCAMR